MSKLVKAKGNMYDWVTHMWNPIIGCPHQCTYCYVKHFRKQPKSLKLDRIFPDLGHGRKIFVGHLTDIFACDVERLWIVKIINHCFHFNLSTPMTKSVNEYTFQSKNPGRIHEYPLPYNSIVGTTIETDSENLLSALSAAPSPLERATGLRSLKLNLNIKTFLTIEPIMDFDLDEMISLIRLAIPNFINIGADSKNHHLPEPSPEKVKALIEEIGKLGIEIRKKSNLKRLLE